MTTEIVQRYPWEVRTTEETVAALQHDFAYAVTHTAVIVHSNRNDLAILVNTRRGQIIPRGVCTFTDGTTMEFQDIGMPQVGAREMTVLELTGTLWGIAANLGLELAT